MIASAVSQPSSPSHAGFADLVEEVTNRLNAGEALDLEAFLREHPAHAERLARLQPALCLLADVSRSRPGGLLTPQGVHALAPLTGTLGDFHIIREIGRGGMGIVYEAEQLSLHRRVALKVLSLAASLDARQLQRFQNEAEAAARLHHTNIVPVYFVGGDSGVHFYAMQFINGQSLADAIAELRRQTDRSPAHPYTPETPAAAGEHSDGTAGQATLSTVHSLPDTSFFRTVAQLGLQAAGAVAHAHQAGIVHRDIKPANLLLEVEPAAPEVNKGAAGFRLWIADFGLAQVQSDVRLTMTGDLLGTLRYMSPEQALARRELVDARTDVYSLGATLYELLTLEPAFPGHDRQELLRQIAFDEPRPLRRLNRAIPAELETIVLKALEKNLADRYATAQELADDLRRWLADEPIRARRPSWRQVAQKWARRHKPLVAGVMAALLVGVAVLAGSVGWVLRDREARRAKTEEVVALALQESDDFQAAGRMPEALSAARRATELLAGGEANQQLNKRASARLADLELQQKLDDVRLVRATDTRGGSSYREILEGAGLDIWRLSVEEAQQRIRSCTVPVQLAAVLDECAMAARRAQSPGDMAWRRLLDVARAADPDPWRTRVRDALENDDRKTLEELSTSEAVFRLPEVTLTVLGRALATRQPDRLSVQARGRVERFLREAQRRHPSDYWINEELVLFYREVGGHPAESLHFSALTVALRPESASAHDNLGTALVGMGQCHEAAAEFREAIRIAGMDSGYFGYIDDLQICEQLLIPRAERIRLILEGKARPKDRDECAGLAWLCRLTERYGAAVRFYAEAYPANPKFVRTERYEPACCAALAGCGLGKDQGTLGNADRAQLRRQALVWLRDILTMYRTPRSEAESDGPKLPDLDETMRSLLDDEDLARVRDPESLARLPEAERKEWRRFWEEVERLRQGAAKVRPATSAARN